MPKFFQEITSFVDVPQKEEGIDTDKFLEAAEGIVHLCVLLSPIKFKLVTSDMETNISKIRNVRKEKYAEQAAVTLQKIVNDECEQQKVEKAKGMGVATDALLWLTRGLIFMYTALDKVMKDKAVELNTAFTEAYNATLSTKHGMFVRGPVKAVLYTVPPRSELFSVLKKDRKPENLSPGEVYTATADSSQEEVDAQVVPWLSSLKDITGSIETIYISKGLEKVYGK